VLIENSDNLGFYTREINITTVNSSRKNVVATVKWGQGSLSRSTQIATRFTNWQGSLSLPPSWKNAILSGAISLGQKTKANKIATQGNYAYVIMESGSPAFHIVNIADSSKPVLISSLTISSDPKNLVVAGDYAYISTGDNNAELQIVDISSPSNPVAVSTFNAPGNADGYGISLNGSLVYMSRLSNSGGGEFHVVDVSSVNSPKLVSTYNYGSSIRDLCNIGNTVFLGTDRDDQELIVLNVSSPILPVLISNLNLPGTNNVTSVQCTGDTLYLGQKNILRAIKVTVPNLPTLLGSFSLSSTSTINDISSKQEEPLIFLATNNSDKELEIINATVPSSMISYQTVNLPKNSNLSGIAYSSMLNIAIGASFINGQQLIILRPN
jgi:hypothetical protein